MKLPRFGVEEWLNVHEKSAIYDIAGVSIKALTMEELFDLSGLDKEAFFAQLLKKKEENLALMDVWIAKEPKASWVRPASVSTSFVKLDVNRPIEDFALELLQDYGVLVVPGNRFDKDSHVRIGYCCDKEVLQKGLEKLSQFLNKC